MIRKKGLELRHLAREEDWLIVCSTLMTVLMILFLALSSYYFVKKGEHYEKVLGTIQKEMGGTFTEYNIARAKYTEKEKNVTKSLEEFTQKEGVKKFTKMEVDQERIKIIFPDSVIFSPGSDELEPKMLWLLSELAERLRILAENEIIVEGHSDNTPLSPGSKFSSNWELSIARALSIIHYLTEIEGLVPERFVPIGYGEFQPLFPNDTPAHRAQNRRIEISIIKKS